jgi:hypothetical protein
VSCSPWMEDERINPAPFDHSTQVRHCYFGRLVYSLVHATSPFHVQNKAKRSIGLNASCRIVTA